MDPAALRVPRIPSGWGTVAVPAARRTCAEVVRNLGPFGNAGSALSGRYNATGQRLSWRLAYASDGSGLRSEPVRTAEVRAPVLVWRRFTARPAWKVDTVTE